MKEIYRILSGTIGQEERLSQIANNLANVSTTGFKKDSSVFVDYLKQQMAGASPNKTDEQTLADPARNVWPVLAGAYTDFSPGTLQQTGGPLDVAIDGEGFFQVRVEGEKQPMLTRAGDFKLSNTGDLQTADGRAVLDDGGNPVKVDPRGGTVQIMADGEVRTGAIVAGRLGVVTVPEQTKLEKYGFGLYRMPEGTAITPATAKLRQGMLEGSNVNAIDEMVRMIQLDRSYQSGQRATQTLDESYAKRIESVNN